MSCCNIDLLTNIGTDCSDESIEKALLVDNNRNRVDVYAHDSEGLRYGGAETKQRRREGNMKRARDDMFSTRVA